MCANGKLLKNVYSVVCLNSDALACAESYSAGCMPEASRWLALDNENIGVRSGAFLQLTCFLICSNGLSSAVAVCLTKLKHFLKPALRANGALGVCLPAKCLSPHGFLLLWLLSVTTVPEGLPLLVGPGSDKPHMQADRVRGSCKLSDMAPD